MRWTTATWDPSSSSLLSTACPKFAHTTCAGEMLIQQCTLCTKTLRLPDDKMAQLYMLEEETVRDNQQSLTQCSSQCQHKPNQCDATCTSKVNQMPEVSVTVLFFTLSQSQPVG